MDRQPTFGRINHAPLDDQERSKHVINYITTEGKWDWDVLGQFLANSCLLMLAGTKLPELFAGKINCTGDYLAPRRSQSSQSMKHYARIAGILRMTNGNGYGNCKYHKKFFFFSMVTSEEGFVDKQKEGAVSNF